MNFKNSMNILLIATTLTLLFYAWTCSANPGLSVQISKKGFDYASQLATKKLHKLMVNAKIPNLSKGGKTQYGLSNIKVNSFSGLSSHVQLIPSNQLKWTLSVKHVQISLNWRYAKKIWWFWIRDSGSARLTFTGTRLSVNIATYKRANGGLYLKATSCSSAAKLRISTSNLILKILILFFKGRINSLIRKEMCKKAMATINNDVSNRVSKFPVTIPFAKDYVFDYGLYSNPVMSSAYMKTNHKAAVYYKNGPKTIPFTPKPFPSIIGNNKMITFIISNYVADTWLYAAYKKGIMKYTLSPATVPANLRPFLKTTCPGSFCIGSIFPEMGHHLPNHNCILFISTTGRPNTVFLPNRIQVDIPAQIGFAVIMKQGNANAFNLKLKVKVELSAKLQGNKLLFSITDLKFTVDPTSTKYDTSAFQNIMNPLLKLLVKYFNDFGPKGLPLVLPDKTQIYNPSLKIVKDAIILASDVKIAPF